MLQIVKARFVLATAALLLCGGAFMGAAHQASAQVSSPTVAATETCTTQDAAATVEPTQTSETATVEPTQATDKETTDLQCGDQTSPDATNPTTESAVEPTEVVGDTGASAIDQQGDHQDTGDNAQTDATTSAQ